MYNTIYSAIQDNTTLLEAEAHLSALGAGARARSISARVWRRAPPRLRPSMKIGLGLLGVVMLKPHVMILVFAGWLSGSLLLGFSLANEDPSG